MGVTAGVQSYTIFERRCAGIGPINSTTRTAVANATAIACNVQCSSLMVRDGDVRN